MLDLHPWCSLMNRTQQMDENKNPHCLASSQFSRLAANPDEISTSASTGFNEGWTQFSGISPQVDQTAFKNLCSWNPMDLPDFAPLSETVQVNSNPNSILTDFGVFNGSSDFHSHGHFDWQRRNSSPLKFKVKEDPSGNLTDVPKKRMQSCSFDRQRQSKLQQYFQRANCDDVDFTSQMYHPSIHKTIVGLDTSDRHSRSSPKSKHTSRALMAENVLPAGVTDDRTVDGRLSSQVFVENWSHVNFAEIPLTCNHSGTPHHLSNHKQQCSDNCPETGSGFPDTAEDDETAYLQMFDPLSLNLDAGTKIDSQGQDHSHVNNTFISTKKQRPYTTSKQWNLQNSNKIHSSDKVISSQIQPHGHSSEAAFSADLSKPSYSDVTKTHKQGPIIVAKPDHSISEGDIKSNTFVKTLVKDEELLKPLGKRVVLDSVLKDSLEKKADQPRLSATSSYGLDGFTAQTGDHKMSSESLALSDKNVSKPAEEANSPVQLSSFHTSPAKSPLSSKPHISSPRRAVPRKDIFFDPKRIFQYENKNKVQNSGQNVTSNKTSAFLDKTANISAKPVFNASANMSFATFTSETFLNNGKPTVSVASSKLSGSARQHDYINNDLKDSSKLTNRTSAFESGQGVKCSRAEELLSEKESSLGKKFVGKTSDTHPDHRELGSDGGNAAEGTSDDGVDIQHRDSPSWSSFSRKKIEKWCSVPWSKFCHYGSICITSILKLIIIILWIILYFVYGAVRLLTVLTGKSWTFMKSHIFTDTHESNNKKTWSSQDFLRKNVGLDENICLPATGEEALKRLLACKGKDPYSILGLRSDSSNEDIKKFYKKQAFLVHPDKNQVPGAEEAFKILGHAFEMIGEPEKRKQYDSHTLEANEVEAMREFADMLSKLQTKIQEAANTMPCDNCSGKHRRVPVERPAYSARFCERCNTRHCAKEGDVWAESTMLGFYWHYFALMDGHVFDITEWMKCHKEYFSHMTANSHTVMYKIASEGNRRGRHHQQPDPDLEDLINQLFKSGATPNGRSYWGNSHPGSDRSSAPAGTHETSAASTAASAKKGRRKKKRH